MSTAFRLFNACSTAATATRNRAGAAAQKSCKRRAHVASSASATPLPGTGSTFASSTGTFSNSEKLRSLYAHTSRRTRSTSTLSGLTASSTSNHGSQPENYPPFTNEASREMVNHLNKAFGGALVFPSELATRLLTHASHPSSRLVGHNGRFAFTGRRILNAYFLMFLHSCPNAGAGADYEKIALNALNTYTLGEHVGREWGIGKVLKWKPMLDPQMITKGGDNSHVGLHKVLGATVEAIAGGVYHQFGATEAHKFFHTHLLPHILLKGTPQGVPDAYHSRALQLYKSVNSGVDLPPSPPLTQ